MQLGSRYVAGPWTGLAGTFVGIVLFGLASSVATAQQVRTQPPASGGIGNGSAACFTATDPGAIITGCDTFLSGGRSAANASQTGLALQRRGGARAALGRIDAALDDFRQMAASGYKVHEAQASIGSLEFQRRRLNEAETAYRAALRVNPSYALAQVGLGHTLIAQGRAAEAVGHFDSALATSEKDTAALLGKGTALAAGGDLDGAIRSFDAALATDPRLLTALYQRAQAHSDKGETTKALADADTAVSVATGEERVRALIYRGRLRNNAKAYDGSIADCALANSDATGLGIRDGSVRAAIEVCLGLARQSKGELAQAQQSYERALTWDRNDVSALAGRGYVLLQRGQYDAAVADFDAALKLDPKSQDSLRFIGLAYSDKGDRANATRSFERAVAADPKDPWPLMIRAIASARDGQRDSALADVSRALALTGSQSSDAILVRGAVSYFLGDFNAAQTDLETALRLNPDNGQAHRMLARLLIHEKRFDEAQRAQDAAARLLPNDATVLLQQGLVGLARKDYGRAVQELTASLAINDAHAEGFAARGQAYEAQGSTVAAISDYRNALVKLALDDDARAAVAVARNRLAALTASAGAAASSPPNATTPATAGGETARPPEQAPAGQTDASLYCRLAEGIFVPSRKYTGVQFDVGCRP